MEQHARSHQPSLERRKLTTLESPPPPPPPFSKSSRLSSRTTEATRCLPPSLPPSLEMNHWHPARGDHWGLEVLSGKRRGGCYQTQYLLSSAWREEKQVEEGQVPGRASARGELGQWWPPQIVLSQTRLMTMITMITMITMPVSTKPSAASIPKISQAVRGGQPGF